MKKIIPIVKNTYNVYRDFFSITPLSCVVILMCYVVNSLYPSLLTYFIAKLFETAEFINLPGANQNEFHINLVFFAVLYIIKNVFEMMINAPRSCGIYAKAKYRFDRRLAVHTSQLPYICFEQTETFEKLNRAQHCINSNIPQRLFFSSLELISFIVGIMGTSAILISFNVLLLPLSIITVLPFFIVRIFRGKEFYKLKRFQALKRRKMDYLWSLFIDKKSIKEMKVFNFHDYTYKKWKSIKTDVINEEFEFVSKDSSSLLFCDIIRISGILISAILCIILVFNMTLSVGQLAACLSAFFMVQNMMRSIFENLANYNTNINIISDYYEFLDLKSDRTNGENIDLIESIDLNEVCFKYPNSSTYALKDINFSIKRGDKIAIVGENGSGKTTLAKLILNLIEPTSGNICINNKHIHSFDKNKFYKLISVVSQNIIHFNMTLKENITISDYEKPADKQKIKDVLSFLGLMNHDNRLDDLLGKEYGGGELSGGEWQKVGIARALYKNCDLMILDEPTSALDPLIENEILSDFISIVKDKTALIISHRIGFCKLVDRVVVVKDGKIVGVGNHTELIANNEYYRYLYQEQQKWYV